MASLCHTQSHLKCRGQRASRGCAHVAVHSCATRRPCAITSNFTSRSGASGHRRCLGVTAPFLLSGRSSRQVVLCPAAAVAEPAVEVEELSRAKFESGGISVVVSRGGDGYHVNIEAESPRPMLLHWAVNDWQVPDPQCRPPNTNQVDDKACQSPFVDNRQVKLFFPAAVAPERIVFVLKETQPENWINNGSCFSVQLRPAALEDLMQKVLEAEAHNDCWNLKDRYVLANDVLDACMAAGAPGAAFMFTYLRLSSAKLLQWARKSSYQSKDIAWMQKVMCERLTDLTRRAKDPWVRLYARLTLTGLPRGGSNGDTIRMGILHIMRDHGIKEGHRPGIEDHFLEQWHQKLHQNTSPEDVTICEAYICFLETGNIDDFWRVLYENGGITRERLATMHCPIKSEPLHLPQMINSMKHYLWILKTCHCGADLDTAAEMVKGFLDEHTRWMLFDLLDNRTEWWAAGRIVDIRKALAPMWREEGASRDLLLLDIALDNYFRTCIERTDRNSLNRDTLLDLVSLIINNTALTYEISDLAACNKWWQELIKDEGKWGEDWALQALAAAQRMALALSAFGDHMYGDVQPFAEVFGLYCNIEQSHITNFAEEVIRGQSVFVLSWVLTALEGQLRTAAGAGPWQVISQVPAQGKVMAIPDLAGVQGKRFKEPIILLADNMGGMEDIPPGVTGVVTRSTTDVLSHVAIRARNQRVLLATCYSDEQWQRLQAYNGNNIALTVTASGDVTATAAKVAAAAAAGGNDEAPKRKLKLVEPYFTASWALKEPEFTSRLVGAKGWNLAQMRRNLPDWIKVPNSIALPFRTFERVLADPANLLAMQQLTQLNAELEAASQQEVVPPQLAVIREVIATQLLPSLELITELSASGAAAGLPGAADWLNNPDSWWPVWYAICRVWASKWNDRAWLSRRTYGISDDELFMGVLLQEMVPAEFAFVLHTANPLTGARNEMFGEVVQGLGEVLVGNYPGRALSYIDDPAAGYAPHILSLPSKRVALFAPQGGTLIARSDTNGEDLDAYAGAGLYDSVPVAPLHEVVLDAGESPLIKDVPLRDSLIQVISATGQAVEQAFRGVPQDIEGVWFDGGLVVVQSRPQVMPV